MVWSPRPWALAQLPTIRLFKAACLPYLPLFPHLPKFLANTMQFNTTCNDYDSWSTPARDHVLREVFLQGMCRLASVAVHCDATAEAQIANLHLGSLSSPSFAILNPQPPAPGQRCLLASDPGEFQGLRRLSEARARWMTCAECRCSSPRST